MTVEKYIAKNSTTLSFHQKVFPLTLTFEGVLVAESASEWKYSPKNDNDVQYRTAFLLYRTADHFFLVKRGESTDENEAPYEDIYKFDEFETLRDWILDPKFKNLRISKPIIQLLEEVVSNKNALSSDERKKWTTCFLEGRS
jgi:hypothetical protein